MGNFLFPGKKHWLVVRVVVVVVAVVVLVVVVVVVVVVVGVVMLLAVVLVVVVEIVVVFEDDFVFTAPYPTLCLVKTKNVDYFLTNIAYFCR